MSTIKQALETILGTYQVYYDAEGNVLPVYDLEYVIAAITLLLFLWALFKTLGWIFRGAK